MKFSASWLKEWVNFPFPTKKLASMFTMAGMEVESIIPAATFVTDDTVKGDEILDISITPNRGDCLSVKGMAREISALTNLPLKTWQIPSFSTEPESSQRLSNLSPALCPRYTGQVIKNVDVHAATPLWLIHKLQ